MLPLPKTPSKADAGIENIKKSLSAEWGIQFPARDSTWSPSKRDPKRAEDRISALIQLLYFKKSPHEGALEFALNQFKLYAIQVASKWQFKPLGERDVVPSFETSNSALRQDFLKKRPISSEDAIKELTKNLEHCLKTTADQVTAVEKHMRSVKPEGKKSPASSFEWLRLFEMTQSLRTKSRPMSPICLNPIRVSHHRGHPKANPDKGIAVYRQLSIRRLLSITQTAKWQSYWSMPTQLVPHLRSLFKLHMDGRLVSRQKSIRVSLQKIHSRLPPRPPHAEIRVLLHLRKENEHTLILCKRRHHETSLEKHRVRNRPKRLVT